MLGNVSPYINVTNDNQWRFCRPNTTTKVPPQDPPNPPQCPLIGNPIDPSTGVKIQTETDYTGPDGLEFKRTYRSSTGQFSSILDSRWSAANTPENPLGSSGTFYNWTYQTSGKWFFAHLPIMTNAVNEANHFLYTPDGTRLQFTEDGNGQPVAKTGTNVSVVKNPDPATQSVWLWEVTRADDSHERYDNQGRLVAKWPRLGEALTTSYAYSDANTPSNIAPRPGLMIRIITAYGRSLNFTYNANGLLATMTDPDGGLYRYAYNDASAPDNLTSVTYPDGHSKTYVYNEAAYLPPVSATVANPLYPHALTGIIDENGVRYATFSYDSNGRAIRTEHAGGVNKHSLSFAGNATTVTDPLNSVSTLNFQTIQGVPRLTGQSQPAGAGCGPAARNLSYDANGNITRRTDFNGNTTCYAYDLTRNLETVRLEGLVPGTACPADLGAYTPAANSAERKISSAWHPLWRVRTRIAEPKRLTTLEWGDSASQCGAIGVLCSKTQQATDDHAGTQGTAAQPIDTRQWHYRYNSRGQLLSSDGPRDNSTDVTDQTDYAYYPDDAETVNNRKRLKTVTDSAGHVTTYNSYDAHGHPTQIVAANGVISDLNYTPRGKLQSLTVA
ncbi:MAG: DUF6531 domain-containing protein, partial [Methylovulum sp.]|nr:DUF6531 domain-containing protein [Methylovulum sp.]